MPRRRMLLLAFAFAGAANWRRANAQNPQPTGPQPELPKHRLTIRTKDGREHVFDVEVATTALQQATGLMFRSSVPQHGGMLFNWGRTWIAEMWMKNTRVPLDMLFIRSDGLIDTLARNAMPESNVVIASRNPVAATLELEGGTADRLGIKEDDLVLGLPPPPQLNVLDVHWPAFQEHLQPGATTSAILAEIPPDVRSLPLGTEASSARGAMVGLWTGWLGRDRAGSVQVMVRRMTADGADVTYAYANSARGISSAVRTLSAQPVGERELRGMLPQGGVLALRLRSDGAMDIMLSEGFLWITGVLSRS